MILAILDLFLPLGTMILQYAHVMSVQVSVLCNCLHNLLFWM